MDKTCIHGQNRRHHRTFAAISKFIRSNAVLCIAAVLAVFTALIVPPDKDYLGYFDLKTLSCLFATLAVICALKNIKFFTIIACKIVSKAGNVRALALALVYITFIGSMFIANDMALITFLPLGYIALCSTGKEKYMAHLFITQNIAANLGGMLTPFGNPQNLFIFTKFSVPTLEFMSIMAPPFIVSILLFTLSCIILPKEKLDIIDDESVKLPKKRTAFYLILFALTVVMVFRVLPYYVCLPIILIAILISDRSALKKVDYALLFTFVFFFIIAGNISRIDLVSEFFSSLLEKSTFLTSVFSCQIISNVPSAILLSEFTENYKELLLGVNIGGAGTLISSLASLITFKEYTSHVKGKTLSYLVRFTVMNFAFLAVLVIFTLILL
ncbi:MAG: citrate transporter [Clostridia bacterium]|nr:citrate transporter [Clostridia bacterium]